MVFMIKTQQILGVKAERSEKQNSQPVVLTYTKSSDQMEYPISTSTHTECSELLLLYVTLFAQPDPFLFLPPYFWD